MQLCISIVVASALLNPANGHYYEHGGGGGTLSSCVPNAQSAYLNNGKYYFGHLLTITSQAEFDFVRYTLGVNDIWIAASDWAVEGDWR